MRKMIETELIKVISLWFIVCIAILSTIIPCVITYLRDNKNEN